MALLRKKRNFKALQLDVVQPVTSPADAEPVATRLAPAVGKKRPPPMTLKAPKILNPGDAGAGADNPLPSVPNGLVSGPVTGSASARRNTYHTHLSNTLANLDMNAETRFDLRNEDLKDLQELGQGNGGSVKKVEHVPSGTMMAKKVHISCNRPFLNSNSTMLDCSHRRQTFCTKANPSRVTDHARLPLQVYHLILRSLPRRSEHLHLYGVHGQGLT